MQKCCKLGTSCVFLVFSARAWTRANFCDHVTHDRGPVGLSILGPNFVLSSVYSTFFVFLLTAVKLGYYSWENLVSSEWVWLEHADLCNGFTPTLFNFYLFLVKLKEGTNFLLVCSLEKTSINPRTTVNLKKKKNALKNIQVLAVKVYILPVTSKAGYSLHN